jgi:hypothetical protein
MTASSELSSDRLRRKTNSFRVGIQMSQMLYSEESVSTIIGDVSITIGTLEDSYPDWHPASYPFEAMLRLFLYRELTGKSYESISESSELAAELGLNSLPDSSVLSRTWRDRFDEATRKFVETAAHYAVKDNYDRCYNNPEVRPKAEVTQQEESEENDTEDDEDEDFTNEQILQTTRLPRSMGLGRSTRAALRTSPTMIRSSLNSRPTWEWLGVERLRALLASNFSVDYRTVTPIFVPSSNSTERPSSMGSIRRQSDYSLRSSQKRRFDGP